MQQFKKVTSKSLELIQDIGLIVIAVATVIAIGFEIKSMLGLGTVNLADLLLLFIYLEVIAMVAIYLKSGKMPIRIPLYIAIVALARYLVLDMKGMDHWKMLTVAGTALILALTVLTIRFGHNRYPYKDTEESH